MHSKNLFGFVPWDCTVMFVHCMHCLSRHKPPLQVVALYQMTKDYLQELDGLVESEAAEAAWVRVHVVATTVVHGLLVRMTSTGTRKARGVRLLDGVVLVCPPYATPCLATCGS